MRLFKLILLCLFISCGSNKIKNKLVDNSKTKYWKILKWNNDNYFNDTLLIKFYPNNEYDLFRFNKNKDAIISLKPNSSSDIVAYQYWTVNGDSVLEFKKRVNFIFSFTTGDTLWFINTKDSLIIAPFTLMKK